MQLHQVHRIGRLFRTPTSSSRSWPATHCTSSRRSSLDKACGDAIMGVCACVRLDGACAACVCSDLCAVRICMGANVCFVPASAGRAGVGCHPECSFDFDNLAAISAISVISISRGVRVGGVGQGGAGRLNSRQTGEFPSNGIISNAPGSQAILLYEMFKNLSAKISLLGKRFLRRKS